MDKISADKKYILAAIIAALFFTVIYYLRPPRVSLLNDVKHEKVIEVTNARIAGWENGKKTFEIYAKEGWTNRDESYSEYSGISGGTAYKNGNPVMKKIQAERAEINKYSGEIEVTSSREPLSALIDIKSGVSGESRSGRKRDFMMTRASKLVYNTGTKISQVDDIYAFNNKYTLAAGAGTIDHNTDKADLFKRPVITAGAYKITGITMEVSFKDDTVKVSGEADFRIKDKQRTDISSNSLLFSTKDYNASMEKNVRVRQKEKTAASGSLDFSDRTKTAVLREHVKVVFQRAETIIKEGTAKKLRGMETRQALKEPTVLYCGSFDLSTNSGNAEANDNVTVEQKGRQAKANHAIYDDTKEVIILDGNVFIKRGDEWIRTNKVIISLKKESFEAIGKVESMFKLKK